uniref:Uncharacterized protein n=1 Tax=Rhizophora mucronata TaxID=61149 RepID=A0A2P2Q9F7_RHIMU
MKMGEFLNFQLTQPFLNSYSQRF